MQTELEVLVHEGAAAALDLSQWTNLSCLFGNVIQNISFTTNATDPERSGLALPHMLVHPGTGVVVTGRCERCSQACPPTIVLHKSVHRV